MRPLRSFPALLIALAVSSPSAVAAQMVGAAAQAKHTTPLPIVFEENRGQFTGNTRYVSRSAGGVVAFHLNGPEFRMSGVPSDAALTLQTDIPSTRMELVAEDKTSGTANYFLGQTATAQLQGIPTYGRLRYINFMPGVDLVFYGKDDHLEHDFIVAPQVDPKTVHFRLAGAASLKLDANGALLIQTQRSKLTFQKPVAYQDVGGKRTFVDAAFNLSSKGDISFRIGAYDHTQPLVIDPVLIFSTYLDGTHQDSSTSVTTDSSGNIYVAGYTTSPDFPVSSAFQTICGTCTDGGFGEAGFISKLDPSGKTLLYSSYFVGNGVTDIFRIKTDKAGNLVGVGYTQSTNFPRVGNYTSSYTSGTFAFSLDPTGKKLNHAEIIGAGQSAASFNDTNANPYGLAVDDKSNVYIADAVSLNVNGGAFPFPVTSGTYGFGNTAAGQTTDIFVAKIGSDGALIYSTVVAPVNPSAAPYGFYLSMGGLGVSSDGSVLISAAASPGMPTTPNSVSPAYPNGNPVNVSYSGQAGFVFALNPNATQLLFATYLPGTNSANTLAVASDDTVYVAGTTSESSLPVSSNAYQTALKAGAGCTCDGGYVVHLSGDGGKILHATYLSGTINYNNEVTAYGSTALDGAGNVFIGGNVTSSDSPQKNPVVSYLDITGNLWARGAYVVGLSPDLSTLVFGSYFSGDGAGDLLSDMTISNTGKLVLTGGTFADSNFLTTTGVVQPNAPARISSGVGYQHNFVASIDLTIPAPSLCDGRSYSFGSVAIGTTSSIAGSFTNCGNAPLTISSLASTSPLVSASPLITDLLPGATYQVQLKFSPVDTSTTTGSVTVTSNAAVPTQRLFFSGRGSGALLTVQSPTVINPIAVPQMTFGTSPGTAVGVLIRNTGNSSLTISSVSISGEFTQVNSCVRTITANGTCSISVTLNPTTSGTKQGTLTIVSNDGRYPKLDLSLAANVLDNPNSPAITFSVPNHTYGDAPIALAATSASSGTFTYSVVSGPASITGSTLTINGTGAVQVLATQTANGSYAAGTKMSLFQIAPAPLAIKANNASRSYGVPNPIFTGSITGVVGNDALLETFATTATQNSTPGTYSIVPSVSGAALSNYTVTATNGTLTVNQAAAVISMTAGSATVAAGQSGTLAITAASTTTGTPTGTVMLQDNGETVASLPLVGGSAAFSAVLPSGMTHQFSLSYLGDINFAASTTPIQTAITVTGADDALTPSTSAQQATPGSAVTYTFQLKPGVGSYPGPVTLSAQGLPSGFTASFSPASVTVAGTTQTVRMTLQAPATKAQLHKPDFVDRDTRTRVTLALALLPLIGLGRLRRRKNCIGMMLFAILFAIMLGSAGLTGCGSSSTPPTAKSQVQTYIIDVTATSGTVQHKTAVTLTW